MDEATMGTNLDKKSFCKWEKDDIKKNINKIYALTANPKFVCEKCARVSKLKIHVCKPHKFDTVS